MLFESFFDTLESAALVISSDLGTPSSVRHGYSRIDDDEDEDDSKKKKKDKKKESSDDDSEKTFEDRISEIEEILKHAEVADDSEDTEESSDDSEEVEDPADEKESSTDCSVEDDFYKMLSAFKADKDSADKDKILELIDVVKTAFPEDLKNLEDLLASLDVRISISSDGIEVKNIRRKSSSVKDNNKDKKDNDKK